ncbi:MAG: hypothetical protein J2P21_30125, partial [Chloracidobacterium sp.]|nr:hypothetical protein [Chloracidobacterium sp.]
ENGRILTRRPLSSSLTGDLRIRAIVLDFGCRTVEDDGEKGEKDDKTNQPNPLGRNIASEQVDQTSKRNQHREKHAGNTLLTELVFFIN